MLKTTSTADTNYIGISYVEWNNNRVKTNADVSTSATTMTARADMTYEVGMPPRNLTVQDTGVQNSYGG